MAHPDISAYCKELYEEVNAEFTSYAEGTTPEQVFTERALQLLADAGETENYHVCYDEKQGKRGTDHKINAYSLYENYETLDLFIAIYVPSSEINTVLKAECEKAFRRLSHFFRNTINKGYVKDIEESSEIYDLANTLYNVPEVKEYLTRINLFILTNGEVHYDYSPQESIAGFQIYNRIIDINYLYNISEKTGLPIEIDFQEMGHDVPCISTEAANGEYKSYLAIIPGKALSCIYEQYGPRLLEQNVRSFLQFTGKINKGIRKTIIEEPHMFFAFNNGIAATADELVFADNENGGKSIVCARNFQIVNGGQTTASIYHTWKKNNADIEQIVVPLKLTILNDKAKVPVTVGRIAECANTQNKVSTSDLSSNREGFILLDSISRALWAPPRKGTTQQTRWFFERARGQYRNERNRLGYTPAKRKAFDLNNPRSQMFTKEQLAKYINCYGEVWKGSKCVIGPHYVVRGNQKNYVQYLSHNFMDIPDTAYFEDIVAKAILFTAAERIYGVKPNSIGDLRYITVPYSIAWLSYKCDNRIDLYKIWQAQGINTSLEGNIRNLMIVIEKNIKENAPGDLYGEWAKKEDCWTKLKTANLDIDLSDFKELLLTTSGRKPRTSSIDIEKAQHQQFLSEIKELGGENWKKIYLWCKVSDQIPLFYTDMAHTIGKKVKESITLTGREIVAGYTLLNILSEKGCKIEKILSEETIEVTI
jgi:hypothetical protein